MELHQMEEQKIVEVIGILLKMWNLAPGYRFHYCIDKNLFFGDGWLALATK